MGATLALERDGQLARIMLDKPKGNVLDAEMVAAVRAQLRALAPLSALKLIVFEGRGAHFSFGASVAEHLPAGVESMLTGFHALFRELEALGVPTAALVRGQCLGGGCELAMFCGRVLCEPGARFGLPEVTLGVFPPIGALLLPWRVGGARAAGLVLSGEILDGESAARVGLADHCSTEPELALGAWFDAAFAPRSAVALRFAWQAARRPLSLQLANDLPALERLYLEGLMACSDPVEGLNAFLERRPAQWRHA